MPLLKKKLSKKEKINKIANKLYHKRLRTNQSGNADNDWSKAQDILASRARRWGFMLNQPLIAIETRGIEPVANWLDKADLFRIIEKISPAIEAVGVLAIPLVLFFASQSYQQKLERQASERLQQQAVREYLNQLSSLLVDVDGSLREPKNERLRTLVTATTLAFFDEPNLNGDRKGQVINFLSEMELITSERKTSDSEALAEANKEATLPILSLKGANLRGANLRRVDLRGANLRGANLNGADLYWSNLNGANLNGADLQKTNLGRAELRGANLSWSNLTGAVLFKASLWDANLSRTNLSGANLGSARLFGADLRWADLTDTNLRWASFTDANLSSADLASSNLRAANFTDANLNSANLRSTDLRETNFAGASLLWTDLSETDLSETDLSETSLQGAWLCHTILPEAIETDLVEKRCYK